MTHQSFVDFMESTVVPARAANPTHRRLDGQSSGGNRAVFGEFRHRGKRWKVHADTHYEPLLVAYNAAKEGADPFVESSTQSGLSLDLTDDLRAKLSEQRYKYVYIYEMPSEVMAEKNGDARRSERFVWSAGDVDVQVKGGDVRQTEGDVRFIQFPHPGS